MRIPRFAFGVLLAGIMVLASVLAVVKVGAHADGTVVLLGTVGPNGPLGDCPLSTRDKDQATCTWFGNAGPQLFGYKINLLSRDGNRVLLGIRTRPYPSTPGAHSFSPFELDTEPARQVWFEPGEPLKLNVPDLGALTLTGKLGYQLPPLLAALQFVSFRRNAA